MPARETEDQYIRPDTGKFSDAGADDSRWDRPLKEFHPTELDVPLEFAPDTIDEWTAKLGQHRFLLLPCHDRHLLYAAGNAIAERFPDAVRLFYSATKETQNALGGYQDLVREVRKYQANGERQTLVIAYAMDDSTESLAVSFLFAMPREEHAWTTAQHQLKENKVAILVLTTPALLKKAWEKTKDRLNRRTKAVLPDLDYLAYWAKYLSSMHSYPPDFIERRLRDHKHNIYLHHTDEDFIAILGDSDRVGLLLAKDATEEMAPETEVAIPSRASDPLKSAALFVAAIFGQLDVLAFDIVVRAILEGRFLPTPPPLPEPPASAAEAGKEAPPAMPPPPAPPPRPLEEVWTERRQEVLSDCRLINQRTDDVMRKVFQSTEIGRRVKNWFLETGYDDFLDYIQSIPLLRLVFDGDVSIAGGAAKAYAEFARGANAERVRGLLLTLLQVARAQAEVRESSQVHGIARVARIIYNDFPDPMPNSGVRSDTAEPQRESRPLTRAELSLRAFLDAQEYHVLIGIVNRLLGYPDMDDICLYLLRQVLNRAPVSERGYAADTVLTQMIRSPRRVRFWKEVAAWADEGITRQSGRDALSLIAAIFEYDLSTWSRRADAELEDRSNFLGELFGETLDVPKALLRHLMSKDMDQELERRLEFGNVADILNLTDLTLTTRCIRDALCPQWDEVHNTSLGTGVTGLIRERFKLWHREMEDTKTSANLLRVFTAAYWVASAPAVAAGSQQTNLVDMLREACGDAARWKAMTGSAYKVMRAIQEMHTDLKSLPLDRSMRELYPHRTRLLGRWELMVNGMRMVAKGSTAAGV